MHTSTNATQDRHRHISARLSLLAMSRKQRTPRVLRALRHMLAVVDKKMKMFARMKSETAEACIRWTKMTG
eukprot:2226104-Pleurochrysis_carterae.AAC.1